MINNFGKTITVENCRRISVSEYLKHLGTKCEEVVLGSVVEVMRTTAHLTATPVHFGGVRFWFLCPHCACRIGVLLIHPLAARVGCRRCLDVEYRAKRFKGMVEGVTI